MRSIHAFVQPFRRTASRLQDGRAQFTLGRITVFFSEKMFPDTVLLVFDSID